MAEKREKPPSVEATVRDIRRATRKKYTAEDKIRFNFEGLRGEMGVRELCRCEGIATNLYYTCSKEFLESGKQRRLGECRNSHARHVSHRF